MSQGLLNQIILVIQADLGIKVVLGKFDASIRQVSTLFFCINSKKVIDS